MILFRTYPQKIDKNVWNAINNASIDLTDFPNVKRWFEELDVCIKNTSMYAFI